MTTMASRIGLLGLMVHRARRQPPSLAQDKCQACVNKETSRLRPRVQSHRPPAPVAGKPAPVEASGASFCPQSARNSCKASGDC